MTVLVGAVVTPTTPTAMTALVNEARLKYLHDEPFEDTLSVAQLAATTTISLTNVTDWAPNDLIECLDGELQRIRPATTPLSSPVTVKRAHDGTTATDHASGEVVLKNPRFRYHHIEEHITEVAKNETWPWVWAILTQIVVPVAGQVLYAVTDPNFRNPITMTQQTSSSPRDIYTYPVVDLEQNLPLGLYSTGMALRIPWVAHATNNITVTYQAKITPDTIPAGVAQEYILHRTCARMLRADAIRKGGSDTAPADLKALISELVGQANDMDRQADLIKARGRVELESQGRPQQVWEGFEGVVGW